MESDHLPSSPNSFGKLKDDPSLPDVLHLAVSPEIDSTSISPEIEPLTVSPEIDSISISPEIDPLQVPDVPVSPQINPLRSHFLLPRLLRTPRRSFPRSVQLPSLLVQPTRFWSII
jgi:hypothetical protein